MGDQGISLDPQRVSFSNTKTTATVKIKNNLNEHIIVKVKCTSNSLFTIHPPVFGMNENDDTSVSLICKDPAAFEKDKDSHYFQFYYFKAKKEEKKTARQVLEARKKGPQWMATHDGKTKICVDYDEKK